MLNAGKLIHEVTVQRKPDPTEVDASGAPIDGTWVDLITAKMARESERSGTGEQFKAGQESAAFVTLWTMRYHPQMDRDLVDVPALRRLVYQGRAYDILDAETIDRKNGIRLRTLAASKVAA
jgi:hypothetical protein